MKIAIVGPYPMDTEKLGGVEVAIVYVQRELLKMPDVSLHIITCKEGLSEPKQVQQNRLTITYLPRKGLGRLTWHRREVAAILQELARIQPDMVHGHASGLYAGAALASPYPSVVTVHGIVSQEARLLTQPMPRLRASLDALYERQVMRRAGHLMLITPYVEQVFQGVFRGRSYLVENACDERFFGVTRQVTPGRLFFAGPVIPRKGVLPMLRALSLVRRQAPQAHAVIAGSTTTDPAYYQACQAYVREANLEDAVQFVGHLAQEQVLGNYAACEVFVLPSFQETAPMVIEQAMAAGVPSVATRAGGVPWMLEDGVTGWTLPVPSSLDGDPPALAEALLKVLQDPEAAMRMGQQAQVEARERFLPSAVAARTYAVYQEVIAAARGRAS
jgi:glycosyltransferase involved in cell wall biosynthesis